MKSSPINFTLLVVLLVLLTGGAEKMKGVEGRCFKVTDCGPPQLCTCSLYGYCYCWGDAAEQVLGKAHLSSKENQEDQQGH
ncbi:hypothetical protein LINPERPRIM_LOCUS23591 [Linum perenne]